MSGSVTALGAPPACVVPVSGHEFRERLEADLFAMELHRRKISKLFSDPDLFT